MKNNFPRFWYESNACWGWVENIDDLVEKCKLQMDPVSGAHHINNINDFLERSLKNEFPGAGYADYGTRSEHNTNHTLKEFLIKNGVDIDLVVNKFQ